MERNQTRIAKRYLKRTDSLKAKLVKNVAGNDGVVIKIYRHKKEMLNFLKSKTTS